MKKETAYMGVRLTKNMQQNLEKLARKNHRTVSEVVRDLLEKGLEIDGYTQDVDFIAGIVRQEVKSQMAPQVERLVKILMKSGKISAAQYFLMLRLFVLMMSEDRIVSFKEMATETRKLGIKYMHFKDHEIDRYLEDEDLVFQDVDRL